jgi:hypothetical protein
LQVNHDGANTTRYSRKVLYLWAIERRNFSRAERLIYAITAKRDYDVFDGPGRIRAIEECFQQNLHRVHLRLWIGHRRMIRAANLPEWLFGEEDRRTKVIPHAFGRRAVFKPLYAATPRNAGAG